MRGKVKWFNQTKGYGFISPDDGGNDVFVHASACERAGIKPLQEGQAIEFEVVREKGGRSRADNLKPIEGNR